LSLLGDDDRDRERERERERESKLSSEQRAALNPTYFHLSKFSVWKYLGT